jgi:phage portal protein BeeE
MIYAPMNLRSHSLYGYSPVEMLINTVNVATRRVASQTEYYREGNTPESLFAVPETWSPDTTQRFQDYFDAMLVGNLGARRRMKFIPAGGASSYIPIKEPALKSDFDEWLVRITCFALSYPPTAFMALANRSIAEQHDKTGEEEGLQNTKLFIADLINTVITDEFVPDGSIEFNWSEEDEVDQERQSKILNRYLENGALTINEVRERLGEAPSSESNASKLMVKTATGYMPIDGKAQPIGEKNDT